MAVTSVAVIFFVLLSFVIIIYWNNSPLSVTRFARATFPSREKANLGSTLEGRRSPVETSAKQKRCLSRQASNGAGKCVAFD